MKPIVPLNDSLSSSRLAVENASVAAWHLKGVGLKRGSSRVFDGLDLALTEPRIGLIGHNGAGKTSLLRMLCGLEVPHEGEIRLNGQAHMGQPNRAVGLMFQNPDDQIIFPTVQEELALSWRSAHGGTKQSIQAGVQQALAARGLADWGPRAMGSLSQGQRQWVCWLALLMARPQVLLLDEPYASLDLLGQLTLAADIAAISQQVIVSTHVLEHVRGYARVLWMERGTVRMDGHGEAVCAAYEAEVQALWLGHKAPNTPI